MFDLLLIALAVWAVIYGVGGLIFRRVRMVEAQRKASLPQEQDVARPRPAAPEHTRDTHAQLSVFDSLYETIRDRLEPTHESQYAEMECDGMPSGHEMPSLDYDPYHGSMGDSATEGVSALHRHADDKVAPPAQHQNVQPVTIPGLNLSFNADTLVQGVIFSEILTRKGRGGRR